MKIPVLLFLFCFSSFLLPAQSQRPQPYLKKGDQMPPLDRLDINDSPLDIADMNSQLIILDFWASWCGPCLKSNDKVLIPLYKRYDRSQVEVIGISNDKVELKWKNAITKWDLPWLHVWDHDQTLVRSFGVAQLPTYFIVDPKGVILASYVYSSELEKTVRKLLSRQ